MDMVNRGPMARLRKLTPNFFHRPTECDGCPCFTTIFHRQTYTPVNKLATQHCLQVHIIKSICERHTCGSQ